VVARVLIWMLVAFALLSAVLLLLPARHF